MAGPRLRASDLPPDTLAAISYTGGTTGTPKGVMLSHGNLLANAQHNLAATGHRADQRWLHVCPMFHVAGIANLLACTWVGAEQVVLPRFDPAAVLETIEREQVTHTVLVPTMLAMLLDAPGADAADLSSLRHVQYAASPISAELQRRVLERLPDCDVAQFYGMTEAAPTVTHLSPEDHRRGRALGSVGTPVPGVEVEVREAGELWIRGPNVMLGYWNRPEATAEALVDGWYRSGDIVTEDEHGYLTLVDRAKDMIITGRRERLLARDRGRPAPPPGGRRGRRLRGPRRPLGRGGPRRRGPARRGHRRRPARPLPRAHRRLQGPPRDRAAHRAAAEVGPRQGAQDAAPRAVLGGPRAAGQLAGAAHRNRRRSPTWR